MIIEKLRKIKELDEISERLERCTQLNGYFKDIIHEQNEEIDKLKVEIASSNSKTTEYINRYNKIKKERDAYKSELSEKDKIASWQYIYDENEKPLFRKKWACTKCGNWQTYGKTKYCQNCGRLMSKENEDADF